MDIANVPEVCRIIALHSYLLAQSNSQPNTLGYGFDDGPNCSHNAFYDYLTSQNQKASVFIPFSLHRPAHYLHHYSYVLHW